MKKSDLSIILVIAIVSILAAFFAGRMLFGDTYTGSAKVKTIDKIDPTFTQPSKEIFNANAINPTVQIDVVSTDKKTIINGN